MGSALLKGWQDCDVKVVEPQPPSGISALSSPDALADDYNPALVVFAVKPQQVDAVVPDYARFNRAGTTFLSIAAGKTIARLKLLLGGSPAIVRAMPNTPAAIGKGITVAAANAEVSGAGKKAADFALQAGGAVEWVADEGLLDAVTALSGSGPAYVFYLVEVLEEAGKQMGLAPDLSMKLARQTLIGSGYLLEQSTESAADLRKAVTSPGGTTQAALEVLTGRMQSLFTEALLAAQKRGRELAG